MLQIFSGHLKDTVVACCTVLPGSAHLNTKASTRCAVLCMLSTLRGWTLLADILQSVVANSMHDCRAMYVVMTKMRMQIQSKVFNQDRSLT